LIAKAALQDPHCMPMERPTSTRMSSVDILRYVNVDAMMTGVLSVVLAGPRNSFAADTNLGEDCKLFLLKVMEVMVQRAEKSKMTTQRQLSQRGTDATEDCNLYMRMCRFFRDIVCKAVKLEFGDFVGLSSVFHMPSASLVHRVPLSHIRSVDSTDHPKAFLVHGALVEAPGAMVVARPVFSPVSVFEEFNDAECAAMFEWGPTHTGPLFSTVVGALGKIDRGCGAAFCTSPLGQACGCGVLEDGTPQFTPQFFWCLFLLLIPTLGKPSMSEETFATAFLCIAAWVVVVPRCTPDTCECGPCKLHRVPSKGRALVEAPLPGVDHAPFWAQLAHLDWVVTSIVNTIKCEPRYVHKNISVLLNALMASYLGHNTRDISVAMSTRFPMFRALVRAEALV